MNVHPYDINSNAYNFFFHPLHKAEANPAKTVIAVIVNIAISIFSFCLWQIPFWIVNRLDHRKIELWNLNNLNGKTEKIQSVGNNPELQVHLPLEKIGRILHGTNTCFLAAAIQLCRQLPSVRVALKSELNNKENISEEMYKLAKHIHQRLKVIIVETEAGNDVLGTAVNEFNSILYQYAQLSKHYIKQPGSGGDVPSAFNCILHALSIRHGLYICEDLCSEEDLIPHLVQRFEHLSDIKLEYTLQVEEDPSKKVSYHLIGTACYDAGHAIAFMKDLAHPSEQYIICDDLHPHDKALTIETNRIWPAKAFFAVYHRVDPVPAS